MYFLAIRQLLSRKRQTILTLLGIVLGTAAYVAISGMMLGFQTFIVDQLVNNDSHIRISARQEPIDAEALSQVLFGEDLVRWQAPPSGRRENSKIQNPAGWFARLDGDPRVAAYSEQLVLQALVTRGTRSRSARLVGSRPERQLQVTNIDKYMVSGKFREISSGNRIVVGEGLLKKLGAHLGESILIGVGRSERMSFKIAGTFRLGVSSIDDGTIFTSVSDVQKLNGTPSQLSDIAVRLFNVSLASALATGWKQTSPDKVESWDQSNSGILSVFTTQDIVRNSMTVSILIVAGFGIYNILSMVINQKRKEIGILRSMGFEPSDISKLFLIQGVLLGALGGVVGLGVGYLACKGIGTIPVDKERLLGGGTMLVNYGIGIYVKGYFLAFGSALVASFLPAWNAGRFQPIDIIRSEGG